jgi:hypothetical protein
MWRIRIDVKEAMMNIVSFLKSHAIIIVVVIFLLIFQNVVLGEAKILNPHEPPPTITTVIPKSSYNLYPISINIIGKDFLETPIVTLGNLRLSNVTLVDSTTISATVPSDLPIGPYSISVINPSGATASFENAFTVLSGSQGVVSTWKSINPLPIPRTEYATSITDDFVYILGGFDNNGTFLSSVLRAKINLDGSLGIWEENTPLPEPIYRFSSVIVNGYEFIAGGHGDGRNIGIVDRTKVNSDGSFGIWEQMSSLNIPRDNPAMVAVDNCIYVLGGEYDTYATIDVEMAKVGEDGSLSSWQSVAPLNKPQANFVAVTSGGYIFALGGYGSNGPIERAEVRPDCTLSPWEIVGNLAEAVRMQAGVVSKGYIYILGGMGAFETYNKVRRAQIYSDGSLGPWELVNPLGTARFEFSAVKVKDFIYAVGGRDKWGEILSTVEQSRVISSIAIYFPFVGMN